jgi:hypothetical protein
MKRAESRNTPAFSVFPRVDDGFPRALTGDGAKLVVLSPMTVAMTAVTVVMIHICHHRGVLSVFVVHFYAQNGVLGHFKPLYVYFTRF